MKEWELQRAVVKYIRLLYPDTLLITPQAEGLRSAKSGYIAKQMGVVPGLPDIMIAEGNGAYSGLAIELKVGKNKLSEKQAEQIERLRKKGWKVEEVRDIDRAMLLIDMYFDTTF